MTHEVTRADREAAHTVIMQINPSLAAPTEGFDEQEIAETLAAHRIAHELPLRMAAQIAELEGDLRKSRRALAEADISLNAIGNPGNLPPADARVCAVIAQGCLVRIAAALK